MFKSHPMACFWLLLRSLQVVLRDFIWCWGWNWHWQIIFGFFLHTAMRGGGLSIMEIKCQWMQPYYLIKIGWRHTCWPKHDAQETSAQTQGQFPGKLNGLYARRIEQFRHWGFLVWSKTSRDKPHRTDSQALHRPKISWVLVQAGLSRPWKWEHVLQDEFEF